MSKEEVKYIIVHCTASPYNKSLSADALDRYHRSKGWKCCGYHYYITRDGYINPMRPLSEYGAHCRGYNSCSIGVCYEGGLDSDGLPKDTRTTEQKNSLTRLLKMLVISYPYAHIVGHRDLSEDIDGDGNISPVEWIKSCPSFDAKREYSHLTQINKQ